MSPKHGPPTPAPHRPSLTPRQGEVFNFLKRNVAERGFPPTVAEIATHFGMRSQNAAAQHLRLMAQKGFIEIEPGRSRGIKINENADPADSKHRALTTKKSKRGNATFQGAHPNATIPIVGRVAAGSPILAEENHEGTLTIDRNAFSRRADYLLRVSGDSMIGAGIDDGDLVAVHRTPEVRDGEIAVVRVGAVGEVTVKRIRRRGEILTLIPENPRLSPVEISLKEESVSMEGLVVGLVRTHIGGRPRSVKT